MLVLSRKEAQFIRLGESITITVVRISADKVRIGIEAPADLKVVRGELEMYVDPPPAATGQRAADERAA